MKGRRGRETTLALQLTPEQRNVLLAWQRSTNLSAGLARRGRVILEVAKGQEPLTVIAKMTGMSRRFIYKWVGRFQAQGLEGLKDKPGRGYHTRYPVE